MTSITGTITLCALLALVTQEVFAQFGLPLFSNFGLPPTRPQPSLFNNPMRYPSNPFVDTSLNLAPSLSGPNYLNTWPSWSSPIQYNRQVPRPPSPARQCRNSGACKQVDYGTTIAPLSKIVTTTLGPPAATTLATDTTKPSGRLPLTTTRTLSTIRTSD